MVYKRPAGSRDDKPARSNDRKSGGNFTPKRSSTPQTGKPYVTRGSDSKPSFTGGRRPTSTNNSNSFDKSEGTGYNPRRSEGSSAQGDRKPFAGKGKPYGSNAAGHSGKPARNFGDKPFGDRKPFVERKSFSDRKPFGDKSYGDKKPFGERKSFGDRPSGDRKPYSDDRSKRTFDNEGTGERKSFGDRPSGDRKPYSDDRPKRTFDNEGTGERKPFNRDSGYKNSTGKKDFANTTSGNKRRDDKRTEGEAPTRTMRGRKNGPAKTQSDLIRLNRYIANAGICSRRKADELIEAGVISVNGEVVNELGYKIDPIKDLVRYNGEPLKREKMVYVLLNKPKDYITTTEDPQERRTVMHLVEKASRERIYPIGRLDRNTTGLLLMTNDGDLADKLSHPRNNIVKLYNVELNKNLTQGDLNKIGFGLELEDGFIKPDVISYVAGGSKREVGIQIHSGKNRIVRRIFESLGYEVVKLDRSVYANLTKKDLPRGRWRFLEEKEVIQLKHLV